MGYNEADTRAKLIEDDAMELIDLIGTIGLGDYESRSKDILCRVYEYFFKASLPVQKEKKADSSTRQKVLLKFLLR